MTAGKAKKKQAHVWERGEHDWYCEPPRASQALFRVEEFDGAIWDPSCGKGAIIYSALEAGYDVIGTDLVNRFVVEPSWFVGEQDFTKYGIDDEPLAPNIVMNPPFYRAEGAEMFIRRALSFGTGKVAAFVDIRFLTGKDRAEGLFGYFPPSRIYVLYPRVSCPPGEYLEAGNAPGGGTADWCWLVWDEERGRPTELRWLNVKGEK